MRFASKLLAVPQQKGECAPEHRVGTQRGMVWWPGSPEEEGCSPWVSACLEGCFERPSWWALLLDLGPQASLAPGVTVAFLFRAALRWD